MGSFWVLYAGLCVMFVVGWLCGFGIACLLFAEEDNQ